MVILDTNVVSEMMRAEPDRGVVRWLNLQDESTVWTSSVSLYELHFGIELLAPGHRRRSLILALTRVVEEELGGRVLDFDQPAAKHAAELGARLKRTGRATDTPDLQIAGIAAAHDATLATRNVKHFDDADIKLVNPWDVADLPPS